MSQCNGVREVAYLDHPGGGQVVVDGNYAYIGHITGPGGTTVVDVSDPKHPRKVWATDVPPGIHSHKVRSANGVMLVNHEIEGAQPQGAEKPQGGLGIY